MPAAFHGKRVAVFGCGAIGGHVAEWIARAGANRIELYDKDPVTIGVLVRQPYTDADIGNSKTHVLADRLKVVGAASGHAGVVKMGEDAGAALC